MTFAAHPHANIEHPIEPKATQSDAVIAVMSDAGSTDPTQSLTATMPSVSESEWPNWTIRRVGDTEGFIVSDGGLTVLDTRTRLMWQRIRTDVNAETHQPPRFTPAEAAVHCRHLQFAGHSDWRVPTLMEALSIVNYAAFDPATFNEFYDRDAKTSEEGRFNSSTWTSTLVAGRNFPWAITFFTGTSSITAADNPTDEVQCVRRATSLSDLRSDSIDTIATHERFVFHTAGVAYDPRTKLSWQREAPAFERVSWLKARNYCAQHRALGGHWRLPDVAELASIVAVTRSSPAIDPNVFPATKPVAFWTATTTTTLGGSAIRYVVDFNTGEITTRAANLDTRGDFGVRCVKGGRA